MLSKILKIFVFNLLFFMSAAKAQNPGLDSIYTQAGEFRKAGLYDSSIAYYQKSFEIAQSLKDTLKSGNSMIGIGIAYDQKGNYEKALIFYFKALSIYEKINNKLKIGGTLKNIGNIYRVLGDYKNGLKYLDQALEIQKSIKDSTRMAMVINDLGNLYLDQKDLGKAYNMYTMVVTNYKKYVEDGVNAYAYNNLGLVLMEYKKYSQSLAYFEKSLEYMKKTEDNYGIALITGNKAELYFKMGDYLTALKFQLQNLQMARDIKSDDILLNAYDNLSKIYQAMGDHGKAFFYLTAKMNIKDSIYKKDAAKNYAEMEAKYQNEFSKKEITLLNQRNEITNIQLAIQKRTKYFMIVVSGLILVLAGFIYKAYKFNKNANEQLNSLNYKLEEANQSKVKLISIITHDLRSPISSLFHYIQLQKRKPADIQLEENEKLNKKVIASADNLLEVMEDLLIWSKSQMDHFNPSWEEISAPDLLHEVANLNADFADNKNITLKKEIEKDFNFTTDHNFIKIILRNLVGNAIKFTPVNGLVTLTAKQNENTVIFSVRDTGPGIPTLQMERLFEWDGIRSDSSGLGLRLVKEFTDKLRGNLTVEPGENGGTTFIVTLKKEINLPLLSS